MAVRQSRSASIVVIEEEEVELMEEIHSTEEEEERPRRSTRTAATKPTAGASSSSSSSSRRRRSVEPVRYAQLQEEDVAMARAKYAQQTQFRKGEKRARPADATATTNAKRTRAEERRSERQARRREALSPVKDDDSWRALPTMAVDGSGPRSLRFTRPADAAVATAVHSTAWRRVRLATAPPPNLLPLSVLTPFADDLERPLESFDASVAAACHVLRPSECGSDKHDVTRETVAALLADATPRVQQCHVTRVTHVLRATRERVRACLAQLPAARSAVAKHCKSHVTTTTVSALERVVANRQRRNLDDVDPTDDGSDLPTYMIGRGEHTVRECGQLPKEPLRRLPPLPFLSRSTTCMGVHSTLPVDDDPIIRTVPVFSTATDNAAPTDTVPPAATLSALDDDRHELVLRLVVAATHGDTRVFRALESLAWAAQSQSDYTALQVRDARARVLALQSERPTSQSTLATRLRGNVGDETTVLRRHDVVSDKASADAWLDAIRALFCRRCFLYNCQIHGVDQPRVTARTDPVYPVVQTRLRDEVEETQEDQEQVVEEDDDVKMPEADEAVEVADVRRSVRSLTAAASKATALLAAQSPRKPVKRVKTTKRDPLADESEYFGFDKLYRTITSAFKTDDAQCSSECFKAPIANATAAVWTPHERQWLDLAIAKVGTNACVLAMLLKTKTCAQMHQHLTSKPTTSELDDARNELSALLSMGRPSHHDHVATARGNTREHLERTRRQRMKDRGSNHQCVPCHHAAGESCNTNACSCMRRDHFCETACGCAADCANRFRGCRCAPGACGTTACPCYFAGRECDPDVCSTCRACEAPLLVATTSKAKVCGNTNLLRGAHAKIGMAESTTHGWGAFALEDIEAGAFLYEYTGELLSQDEAERRGNVYDRNAVSFLFDLNEDVVVDAARKGNKSKFANHAAAEANCAARIMLVRGDHRIGLYAKRAISKGDELFFDYGHHGVVPDWSQSRMRSTGTEIKGLRPGDESVTNSTLSSPQRHMEFKSDDEDGPDDAAADVVDVTME